MSLAARRVALSASRIHRAVGTHNCRAASSSHGHHDNHDHHHHQEDTTVYPKETFGGSLWRKVVLFSAIGVAGFKLAPEAGEDVYLTRWMALYSTPRDYWMALNAKHTVLQEEAAAGSILLSDAQRPPVHRFQYPQSLVQGSAFKNAVGAQVDMESVVIR